MWEKIKKFLKWIADHTGISWVARKISSGWKWLFGGKANATQQNTSQRGKSSGNERQETHSQSKDNTLPKTPSGETILALLINQHYQNSTQVLINLMLLNETQSQEVI